MFSEKRLTNSLSQLADSNRATVSIRRRILVGAVAVTFACLMLVGCGSASTIPDPIFDGPSGFRGVARVVAADGTLQGPLPNVIITVQTYSNPSGGGGILPVTFGSIVAQTQADAQGNYSIMLSPGTYGVGGKAVQPNNYTTFPRPLTVVKSQFTQFDVPFRAPAS